MKLKDRIDINPEICCRKPRIKGTRILISIILEWLEAGKTFEDIFLFLLDENLSKNSKLLELAQKISIEFLLHTIKIF